MQIKKDRKLYVPVSALEKSVEVFAKTLIESRKMYEKIISENPKDKKIKKRCEYLIWLKERDYLTILETIDNIIKTAPKINKPDSRPTRYVRQVVLPSERPHLISVPNLPPTKAVNFGEDVNGDRLYKGIETTIEPREYYDNLKRLFETKTPNPYFDQTKPKDFYQADENGRIDI